MRAHISLIAALSRNGVIGEGLRLPWRLPSDLKHFKAQTLSKPVLMGRKTFESIGKPLPGRETLVLTRNRKWQAPEGIFVAYELDEALKLAQERAEALKTDEIMVAGGGEIYRLCIGRADRLLLTWVDAEIEGDTRFPDIDPGSWQQVSRTRPKPVEKDEYGFEFAEYRRT